MLKEAERCQTHYFYSHVPVNQNSLNLVLGFSDSLEMPYAIGTQASCVGFAPSPAQRTNLSSSDLVPAEM